MAGVRDIAAIIDQATRVGAKVVLVGDHHQLPEVGAGGAFRAALGTLGTRVVELTVNRRQQHSWEQAALDQLRHGNVTTYREHGRVILVDNPDQLHAWPFEWARRGSNQGPPPRQWIRPTASHRVGSSRASANSNTSRGRTTPRSLQGKVRSRANPEAQPA